jgi:hypothetical protein
MALAALTVEVAFTKGITETADDADFTTISTANPVREFQIVRGRKGELDTTQAGRAVVICSNSNGKLDPSNTGSGSPYYVSGETNVIPMRHIRIKATDPSTSTAYVIFRGFVERWVQEYPHEKDQLTRLECVDAFKMLSLAGCDGSSESEQLSGLRVANLLDQAEWVGTGSGSTSVAGYRDIDNDANNQTVPAKTYAATLDVLLQTQDIETAEIGSFFVSRSGVMTFLNRVNRIAQFASISAIFSDTSTSGGRVKYNQLNFESEDLGILNRIDTIIASGSSGAQKNDTSSQTKFGVRSKTQTGLMLTSTGDADTWAEYILGRQSIPSNRVKSITLRPQEQDALWAVALQAELGNAYTVERTPAAGNSISNTVIAERILHKGKGASWVTEMELSPADTAGYWTLDDGSGTYAAFSDLGNTTRLFF